MKLNASRLAKPALITVSVIAAIGVVGFASGPVFVRALAEDKLGELLGRKVSIGELTINPYTLSATLGKVAITEPDGRTPFVSFERLYANLSSTSLAGGIRVEQLSLEQPKVHLVRLGDNRYNITDLIEKFSKPSPEPTRFALANIRISGGQVTFDDRPLDQAHTVDKLQLGIPFVSNFPADLDVEVQPEFTATVDGTTLALGGEAKPFKSSREANLSLRLEGIDLPRWLPYSPVPLPVTVKSALLDTDLAIRFQAAGKQPELSISGNTALKNFAIQDKQGRPLLQGERLTVDVASIKPFAREINIREAALIAPKLNVERDRNGVLNWQTAFAPPAQAAPATATPPAPAAPWKWSLAAARVRAGEVSWSDAVPRGGYQNKVQELVLDVGRSNQSSAIPLRLSLKTARDEAFSLETRLTPAPLAAEGKFEATAVDMAALAPYFAEQLRLKLVSAKVGASGDFAVSPQGQAVTLSRGRVTLDDLRLTDSGKEALALKSLLADTIALDTGTRRVSVGTLMLDGPSASLVNDRQGLNAARWFVPATPSGKAASRPAAKAPASGKPWQATLDALAVSNGAVKLRDTTQRRPVAMDLADIRLNSSKLASDRRGDMPLDLAMTVNKRGRLAASGRVDPFALSGNLDLRADRLDLAPLTVMATQAERVNVRRAELDTRGKLAFAKHGDQLNASYRGNVAVNNVRVTDELNAGTELLRWRTLKLDGLDVNTAPANRVGVRNIALDSFFARVVLNQDGKLNLREIQNSWGGSPAAAPLEEQTTVPAKTVSMPGGGTETTAKLPAKPAPSAPMPDIRIDRIALSRGDVNWTDNFVRPNYRADLTQMKGTIGRIATRNNQAGEVDITGKVNNDAPLTIAGKVNPFAKPVVLDMSAAVKGLDLPPLSPYSGKYAGYAIEKGKLSVDLHYVVDAGKLTAQNKLFLDQLTFGDKVDSPSATKLPVLLAVSLLKNRKGEIDVNLPVSGSLDDPQFSVGGLVVRVIVNLLEKAITSPFTLLANAFGGDAEKLSQLEFTPGTFALDASNRKKLDDLASILNDKPDLKLEIHGEADPSGDLAGAQRVRFEEDVARRWQNQGGDPDQKPDAKAYAAIVKDIYSDGKFKKPRNMIGLAKSLPVEEMEKLIVANTKVSDKDVSQLASRRALAVKNYLTDQAKLPGERLFIVGSKEAGKSRVEFKLK